MLAIGRGILASLVALLVAGTFLFPYVGGADTAYALIGVSLILIFWNFIHPPRFAFDPGAWMFLITWVMIAIAFAITNLPGRTDFLLAVNFAMFALYPLLSSALQRFARPENSARVATFALAGVVIAFAIALYQVRVLHFPRAAGYGSNPIPSATVALFLGFFALLGLFAVKSRWRYAFLLGPVVGVGTVLLAGSRGPLLALPALGLIALIMLPVKRIYGYGFAAVVMAAAGVTYLLKPGAFGRFAALPKIVFDLLTGHPIDTAVDASGGVRYAILQGSLGAFRDSPWLGYGWYMKVPAVERYMPWDVGFPNPRAAHLHSDILNLGVSAGIVGLVAYALVLLAPIVSALSSPSDSQRSGRIFLAFSLSVGYLCCGAVNLLFGFEFMTTMYVCFAAIFVGYCRDAPALVVPQK